jgi:hypothetical protein
MAADMCVLKNRRKFVRARLRWSIEFAEDDVPVSGPVDFGA